MVLEYNTPTGPPQRTRAGTPPRLAKGEVMRSPLQTTVALLGRILLSSAFLMLAALKVADWTVMKEFMTGRGMQAVGFWGLAAVVVELVAGACLLLGFETRIAALALMAYLIPVTLVIHNFWA